MAGYLRPEPALHSKHKVPQVCPGIALATRQRAIGVERSGVLGIARLLIEIFPSEVTAGHARPPAWQDAIHHIDAQAGVFDNLLRRADSINSAACRREVFERGFDHLAGALPRLTDA